MLYILITGSCVLNSWTGRTFCRYIFLTGVKTKKKVGSGLRDSLKKAKQMSGFFQFFNTFSGFFIVFFFTKTV